MLNFKNFFIFSVVLTFFLFAINKDSKPLCATDSYYDFEMVSISTTPSSPALNQAAQIKVKVKYAGDTVLTNNMGIKSYSYQFTNFDISSSIIPSPTPSTPINTGDTFEYVFNGVFTKLGESALSFKVNDNNELFETRTSNNDLRVKTEVVSAEDIKVSSVATEPSIPIAGQKCVVTVTVQNNGKVDLFSDIGLQDFLTDFEDFNETNRTIPLITTSDSLKIGGSLKYIFEGTFVSAGSKKLVFTTNNDNRLNESVTTNNSFSKIVKVGEPDSLDISVSSIELSKNEEELLVGAEISLIIKVKNESDFALTSDKGLLERDYNYRIGGDYDFIFKGFEIVSAGHDDYPTPEKPLAPGKLFSYTFSGKVKEAGSGFIYFKIDTRNDLIETDETNNELSIPYSIYSKQSEIDDFGILNASVTPISSSSVIISWETDRDTNGSVLYKQKDYEAYDRFLLTTGLSSWPSSNNLKIHKVTLTNLTPGEEYRFYIKASKNGIYKETELKSFFTFKDDDFVFVKKPIYKIEDEKGHVLMKWSTNFISDSYVYYKKDGKVDYVKKVVSDLVLDHEVLLSGLEEEKYFFYVSSKSKTGAKIESEVGNFNLGKEIITSKTVENNNENKKSSVDSNSIKNKKMYNSLKGKIILTVEKNGEAYYVNPKTETIHYLGRPKDAFAVMREQGVGITNNNLYKIPIGVGSSGADSDGDGLSDNLEDALSLDSNKSDTDDDGYSDSVELLGGFSPWGVGKQKLDNNFRESQKGKILLQVEKNGEAWYVNPGDGKRYFLGRPADAFNVMRTLGLGISSSNFNELN